MFAGFLFSLAVAVAVAVAVDVAVAVAEAVADDVADVVAAAAVSFVEVGVEAGDVIVFVVTSSSMKSRLMGGAGRSRSESKQALSVG